MTVIHSFLAGTTIDFNKSLFFETIIKGNIYLGFARSNPMWGYSNLMKISHAATFPSNVIALGSSSTEETTKFYDLNSGGTTNARRVVNIGYVDASIVPTSVNDFVFLDASYIGNLELEYANKEWVRIKGLNMDYLEYTLRLRPIIKNENSNIAYDYYIFNYNNTFSSRIKIQKISEIELPTLKQPVRLMYNTNIAAASPSSSFGNNIVGDLVKTTNILGEMEITGLLPRFVQEGSGYILNNNLTNSVFFLSTPDGNIIQDKMKYLQIIETETETSLVFSYPVIGESILNSGRLKLTTASQSEKLAVFPEKFSEGQETSDITPAPLTKNYINLGAIHSSIFDVKGLVRISGQRHTEIAIKGDGDIPGGLNNKFFYLYSPHYSNENIETVYYIWYNNGTGSAPLISGVPIVVNYTPAATASTIATLTASAINAITSSFTSNVHPDVNTKIIVKNKNINPSSDAKDSTDVSTSTSFTFKKVNEIRFSRRVDNIETENILASVPEINSEIVDVITIDGNPDSTVKFMTTEHISKAIQYYFDLIRLKKVCSKSIPTNETYRQLFLCYNPKTASREYCSLENYSHSDLFSTNEHSYNLGTILYMANKKPIVREHLSSDEDFTILI